MKGLLVRVGADQSEGGGFWNGPADSRDGRFVYVSIPECQPSREGLSKPYSALRPMLDAFGHPLPGHLGGRDMHLDPDFDHLTYGDQGERAKQLVEKVGSGDLLVFYAGLRDVHPAKQLVYALIGLFVIDKIVRGEDVPTHRWGENAHTRRVPSPDVRDVIVRARPQASGRLERCIPIGSYRERAYRVWPHLQDTWGGLTVRDGYLQRSARLPEFQDAPRFYEWFKSQGVGLIQRNN